MKKLTNIFLAVVYLMIGLFVITFFDEPNTGAAYGAALLIAGLCGGIGEVKVREGNFLIGAGKYGLVGSLFALLPAILVAAVVFSMVSLVAEYVMDFPQLSEIARSVRDFSNNGPLEKRFVFGHILCLWFVAVKGLWGKKSVSQPDGGSYSGGSGSSGYNYSTSYFDGTSPTLTYKDHDDLDAVQAAIDRDDHNGV